MTSLIASRRRESYYPSYARTAGLRNDESRRNKRVEGEDRSGGKASRLAALVLGLLGYPIPRQATTEALMAKS